MRIRFSRIPPGGVTVAEWFRRQPVELSTSVEFAPVTPVVAVVQRIGLRFPKRRIGGRVAAAIPVVFVAGVPQLGESSRRRSDRFAVRGRSPVPVL